MAQFDTAATIVSDAAKELGLVSASISDPYSSTDANILQLTALLKSLGQELVRDHPWSQLQNSYSFSTSNGTATYALPDGFAQLIDGSGWNRSTQLPLGGPLNARQWELLQAQSSSLVVTTFFRMWGNLVQIYPTPTSTQTIAYAYRSRFWAQPNQTAWAAGTAYAVGDAVTNNSRAYRCITAGTSAGSGGPTTTSSDITDNTVHWRYLGASGVPLADAPSYDDDVCWFDSLLLRRGLKLFYLREKGFDTTAAQQDFDKTLWDTKGADGAHPTVYLGGTGLARGRFMDGNNIPDTGYGS